MTNKNIVSLAALLAASLSTTQAQTTITAWDFDAAGKVAAPDNSPAPSTGAGTATALGMNNNYTYATTPPITGSTAGCDVTSTAGASSGSGSYAWRVRGVDSATVGNGWNSAAPIGTQGASFSASTLGYDNISVSLDVYATTQAPANFELEYTLDGINWNNALITSVGASGATIENNSTSPNTVDGSYVMLLGNAWNNQITASLSGITGANNDPNFAIEFVNASTGADDVSAAGGAYNNNSGNIRFDNVDISGTAAVPEPTSLALFGLGLTGLAAFRKSRKA